GADSSIFLDALDIHDAAPAGRVTLDVVLHLLRRGRHRDVADDRKLVTNVLKLENFADLPIEPVDDGTRGAARRGKAEPRHDLEAGQRLGDGRDVGLKYKAFAGGDRQPPQRAAVDLGECDRAGFDHDVEPAAQQVLHDLGITPVRNAAQRSASFDIDQFA